MRAGLCIPKYIHVYIVEQSRGVRGNPLIKPARIHTHNIQFYKYILCTFESYRYACLCLPIDAYIYIYIYTLIVYMHMYMYLLRHK